MKKSILNLGTILNKTQQLQVHGGDDELICNNSQGDWVCFSYGCVCIFDGPLPDYREDRKE